MTKHDKKVANFMRKAGQDIPAKPTVPNKGIRALRARLILEETLETLKALGVSVIYVDGDGIPTALHSDVARYDIFATAGVDMRETLDGLADIRVVTTGTFLAFGVDPESIQDPIDDSNLAKFTAPKCLNCGTHLDTSERITIGHQGLSADQVKDIKCVGCGALYSAKEVGGYCREDGKWVKPHDWKAPDLLAAATPVMYDTIEPNMRIALQEGGYLYPAWAIDLKDVERRLDEHSQVVFPEDHAVLLNVRFGNYNAMPTKIMAHTVHINGREWDALNGWRDKMSK